MSVMDETVQDGVGVGGIADDFVPTVDRKLGGDHRGAASVALFEDFQEIMARGDGRHPRLLRNLGRADLLILDDWGLEPLDAAARHDLLEILEERYGRRSTMITSQLPVDRWHEIIGDPTYADAILDRLVHNAHRIELEGESMRRTRAKQSRKD